MWDISAVLLAVFSLMLLFGCIGSQACDSKECVSGYISKKCQESRENGWESMNSHYNAHYFLYANKEGTICSNRVAIYENGNLTTVISRDFVYPLKSCKAVQNSRSPYYSDVPYFLTEEGACMPFMFYPGGSK